MHCISRYIDRSKKIRTEADMQEALDTVRRCADRRQLAYEEYMALFVKGETHEEEKRTKR